jgi:selenocysteine lyase/cysteine desulfurase
MNLENKEQSSKFGLDARKTLFHLDDKLYFTNHGSYGSVPKPIYSKRALYQLELEKSPDVWFRYTSFNLWNENRQALADYLNIDSQNLVLTENATDSINSIVKSIEFDCKKDVILANEYTYNAVLNTLEYVASYRHEEKVKIVKVPIEFPIESTQQLIEMHDRVCREIIEQGLQIRLVVVDHISSASALLFPLNELIQSLRKWDTNKRMLILVDGAHAIGQTQINLDQLDCDYYCSNLHKWFFSPRGVSFLYFRDLSQAKIIQPNIISHYYGKTADMNFFQRGTRDNTSWFLIKDCIDFYEANFGGLAKITSYTSELLDQALELLTKSWQTEVVRMPKELEAPFMKLVKLPHMKNYQYSNKHEAMEKGLELLKDLYEKYSHDACIVVIDGQLCCRISCFVYNVLNDYISLRDSILDLNK